MWSFLYDLVRNPGVGQTVVVMDDEEVGRTRRYRVHPNRLVAAWGGSLFVVGLLAVGLLTFTPLRTLIPGYGTEEMRRSAHENTVRVSALQDSVAVQREHIKHLRQLVTGRVDSLAQAPNVATGTTSSRSRSSGEASWVHGSAIPMEELDVPPEGTSAPFSEVPLSEQVPVRVGETDALPDLRLPMSSPIEEGFPTRGFDSQAAHYGVDIAVSEGTQVRAVGEGVVVLADWTREGGHTIAVQHADGYLSVYKHNRELLKEVGDRVYPKEALAVSGNTGEITTGPHIHFELWRDGQPRDPRPYVTEW